MRRSLPLLADHSLGKIKSAKAQVASDFERELRETAVLKHQRVSCRSGCANCCHHPVHVSLAEGVLIYRFLTEHGRWTPSLREKIRKHAEQTKDLPFEVWFLSAIPCPLLNTANECSAYKGRPLQCQLTYSMGDPDNCHPHRMQNMLMLERQTALTEFYGIQNRELRRHGAQVILMPLSLALLMAEKIVAGEIELESADMAVLREYMEIT